MKTKLDSQTPMSDRFPAGNKTRNLHERRPPYLREGFFREPANQFWETASHTEAAKEYFRGIHQTTRP